jgi:hypothetical protein
MNGKYKEVRRSTKLVFQTRVAYAFPILVYILVGARAGLITSLFLVAFLQPIRNARFHEIKTLISLPRVKIKFTSFEGCY